MFAISDFMCPAFYSMRAGDNKSPKVPRWSSVCIPKETGLSLAILRSLRVQFFALSPA